MTFPFEHNASDLKVRSTNDGSILITGSLDREDGFFGEFKLNSALSPVVPLPDQISNEVNLLLSAMKMEKLGGLKISTMNSISSSHLYIFKKMVRQKLFII